MNNAGSSSIGRVAPRDSRSAQRGEGHFKLIVVLALFGTFLYVAFKITPPYVNNYQLQDTVETESRFFAAHTRTEQKARENIWAQIQSLGIPVTQDAIKVEVVGRTAIVSVNYTVTVSIFGYDVNLDFHPKSESPVF